MAAFKRTSTMVQITSDEFHVEIDSAFKKTTKKPGKPSHFTACVASSVQQVFNDLRGMADYHPMFLTDDAMNINKFGNECGGSLMDNPSRARYRYMF